MFLSIAQLNFLCLLRSHFAAFHKQSEQSVPAPQPVMIEEEEDEGPEPTPPIFILSGMSQEVGTLWKSFCGPL